MTRDYYAVLGVATAASTAQIRRAYQRLARQYSPDVNLWQQEARAKEFVRLGERLTRIAEHRRSGTVIQLSERLRQWGP